MHSTLRALAPFRHGENRDAPGGAKRLLCGARFSLGPFVFTAGLAAKPPHLQAALALRAERAAGYAHARPTLKCAALRRGIAGVAPRALAVLRKTVAAVEPIGRWPLLV